MNKILQWIFSGRGLLWFLLVWTAMLLTEFTGLFRLTTPNAWQVFQSNPSRALAAICALSAVGALMNRLRHARQINMLYRIGLTLYFVSIVTLCAAFWVSAYTHFEGDFIRSKGESFNAFPSEYIKGTVSFRSTDSIPQVGMTFTDIRPISAGGRLDKVEADVLYAGRTTDRVLEGTLSSAKYFISDWTLVDIVDFGYSVLFSLRDLEDRELESAMLPLKTFPPGTEDKFEATFPGYQFYIQVIPDPKHSEDLSTGAVSLKNPSIKLRITRNKDIVYDDVISTQNKVQFDNLLIAFPELTYWVKVRMLRDFGLPVATAGTLLMLAGFIMLMLGRYRASKPTHQTDQF